jgi:hypothetical protein
MPRQRYDIGSKWLLHNQGQGALLVGGLKDVQRIEPMPAEIVQHRKWPDGLLQAFLRGKSKPYPVLVEVATYPERRALRQAMDDLALAFSALRHLPELLMLVLRPKGKFRVGGKHEVRSKLGLSRLEAEWKVVELWTLPTEEYLAAADVGATPWITLMDFPGPPEALLERCADKIEREASGQTKADLLAVAQVMTGLRFPDPELRRLLGGIEVMFESPVLQEFGARRVQDVIRDALKDRFGSIPRDVGKCLREIIDEKKLRQLSRVANKCPDMDAFRAALLS